MRVFCIIDGLGDKPCKVLNGKTPLEYARIYNLNYLARNINRNIKLDIGFEFKHTIEHRAVLVLKKNQGVILNNKVSNVDSEYSGTLNCRALNRNAICTAGIINEFLTKSKELLQDHKINKLRENKGLLAANFI